MASGRQWSPVSHDNHMDRHSLRSGWHILDLCSNCSKSAFDTSTDTRWLDSLKNQPQKMYSVMKKYDDLKNGCSHSAAILFFFFFFHGRCLNWEKLLCSCFKTHCRLFWKPMIIRGWAMAQSNRSGSEFCRHSSLYLSINWSIDRAILNLSEKLHLFIVLGITAIGWFSSF